MKVSKYYFIILDFTPEVSHQHQLTVVVVILLSNESNKQIKIRELLLGFVSISDSPGPGLMLRFPQERDMLVIWRYTYLSLKNTTTQKSLNV